jgi:alpha-beta hydrolase superfamily lysophospholipase
MATVTARPNEIKAPRPETDTRAREFRVFAAATAVGVLHALDDAVLNRQPGVPLGQHAWALLVTVLAAAAGVLLFRRSRPGVSAALALTFGVLASVNGGLHVIHIVRSSTSGSDVTGAVAAVAGVALVGLAALIPFRHRGEGDRSRAGRWAIRAVATVGTVLTVVFVLMPISVGIVMTHKYRQPVGPPPSPDYREVTFQSTDGLELSGWYTPSRNRAAVVIVASARGDRLKSVVHAELLATHGYGVLLYDARGTGLSEGTPNGYGWNWDRDVEGALAFLREQPDVDADRIGGLGLSTGADVLIEVAAEGDGLKAVVSDGATLRSLADIPSGRPLEVAAMAPALLTVQLLSGSSPGAPLRELVADVAPTSLLLIAAGSLAGEREANATYAAAAHEPVELWDLPEARHTGAIRDVADEYERRVIGHFDSALLD